MKTLLPLFIIQLLILSSCKKEDLLTDSSAKIEFSTDSVLFDTVFRYAGSTTKIFKIYNNHSKTINISKAFLATGKQSAFKINIDGVSGGTNSIVENIEILAGDSAAVFVQVFVTPSSSSPLLIRDSLVFETNGNIQDIKLTAIGQDVYLHKPTTFPVNGFPAYSIMGRENTDTIIPNDKPHLFFGYTIIDENCKATIKAGTKLHFHVGAVLMVYKGGTLNVQGSKNNEVVFQGDRLESDYKDIPGQWGKIWFSAGSINNKIDWAIIKNGSIGIHADTTGASPNPTLQLTNTIIKNMAAAAIFGQGTFIRSNNCVFANCGQYVAYLSIGGRYKFEHCTFANYWSGGSSRSTPVLYLNNYYQSGNTIYVRDLDSAYFGNCIIYGNIENEIELDSSTAAGSTGYFSYKFDHCLLKTTFNTTNSSRYNTVYKNDNPAFKDISTNDYRLHSASAFPVDKGSTSIFIGTDLNNQLRPNPNTSLPDLGAYEFY